MEQREIYRASPSEEDGLEVELETLDGQTFVGEVLDLSREGAGLLFAVDQKLKVSVGDRVKLTFEAPWLRASLSVPATAQHRSERRLFQLYGLKFEATIDADALSGRGRELFNRRRTFRVTPESGEKIEVSLTVLDGSSVVTSLVDISATGLCVEASVERDSCLVNVDRVGLELILPGNDEPVQLQAWIRNRRAVGDTVLYGLEFDAERSGHFVTQERALISYVMRRQQAKLRQLRSTE